LACGLTLDPGSRLCTEARLKPVNMRFLTRALPDESKEPASTSSICST
jgi:hypothetical protein